MVDRRVQLFIVIASSILTLIATDMLLPSLPQIAQSFSVSSKKVKLIISAFLIGQFATALLWGVIADRLGKKQTLFWGMLLFSVASLLSLFANSMNLLLFCRFLQGAGGVVVPVAGWALIQDLYPKDESARIMTWVGALVSIIPIFAPVIGGTLDVLYGWQANVYCVAIYSATLMLLMWLLSDLQKTQKIKTSSLRARLGVYADILHNRTFISYITLFGLLNCGEWCFLTVAPFYYQHVGIAPDVMGLFLMLISVGYVLGSILATWLFKLIGVDRTIHFGILTSIFSSLTLIASELFHWSSNQLFNALDISLFIVGAALLWGGTTSRALQCFDDYRGAASAVRILILICFSTIGTLVGRLIDHNSLYSVGLFFLLVAVGALIIFNNKEFKVNRLAHDVTF